MNDDLTELVGELKIQVPYASGLRQYDQLKQVVVRVILRGLTDDQEVYKVVMLIDKNKWCLAMRLPLLYKY